MPFPAGVFLRRPPELFFPGLSYRRFAGNEVRLPALSLHLLVLPGVGRVLWLVRERLTVRMLMFASAVLVDVVLFIFFAHADVRVRGTCLGAAVTTFAAGEDDAAPREPGRLTARCALPLQRAIRA